MFFSVIQTPPLRFIPLRTYFQTSSTQYRIPFAHLSLFLSSSSLRHVLSFKLPRRPASQSRFTVADKSGVL